MQYPLKQQLQHLLLTQDVQIILADQSLNMFISCYHLAKNFQISSRLVKTKDKKQTKQNKAQKKKKNWLAVTIKKN